MFNFPLRRSLPQASLARLEELLAQAERTAEPAPARAIEFGSEALYLSIQLNQEALRHRVELLMGKAHFLNADSKQALNYLESLVHAPLGPRQSTELYYWLGRSYNDQGDAERATTHLVRAAEQAQAAGFGELNAAALNALAEVYYTQGSYVEALTTLNQAVQLARVLGQTHQEAKYLNNIGQIFTRLGNYAAALENLLQAYSLIRQTPDHAENEAAYLLSIGTVHQQMGNLEVAHGCFRQALEWGRNAANRRVECVAFNNLANVALLREDWEAAKGYFEAALAIARDLGNRNFEMDNLDGLGQVYRAQGLSEKAIWNHQMAFQMAQDLKNQEGAVDALLNLGRDYLASGQTEAALAPLEEALGLASRAGRRKSAYEAHLLMGKSYKMLGDFERALEHHESFFAVREQVFEHESRQQGQMLAAQFALERARHERTLMQQLTQQAHSRTAERIEQLELTQLELLDTLAVAGEYRHNPTDEHVFRVAEYAAQIATALGWSGERVEQLRQATLLHDLGKVGVPEGLLEKNGSLEGEERLKVQRHTEIGRALLEPNRSPLLQLAAAIAHSHHERWDGGGYPQGLRGEQIPLAGRIVAIADGFDVMTKGRAYQPAMTAQEATAELKRQSGRQFDPELVEAALKVFR